MGNDALNFVQLVQAVKTCDHLQDMLDDIEATSMVTLLARVGFEDARTMLRRPRRMPRYIGRRRSQLLNLLAREQPARETVVTWLSCQVSERLADLAEGERGPGSAAWVLPALEKRSDEWISRGAWWKVSLAIAALHLLYPDMLELQEAEVNRIVRSFGAAFPNLFQRILDRVHGKMAVARVRYDLAVLREETESVASLLKSGAEQLQDPGAWLDPREIDTLTKRLHKLPRMFADLKALLAGLAARVSLPGDISQPDKCRTLSELAMTSEYILDAIAQAEAQAQKSETFRDVIPLLQPVLDLVRQDGEEMPELLLAKEKAQALIQAIGDPPLDESAEQELQRVRDGTHPLLLLVQLASRETVAVEKLVAASDLIGEAFGRPLAVVAVAGHLTLAQPEKVEPTTTVEPPPPEPEPLPPGDMTGQKVLKIAVQVSEPEEPPEPPASPVTGPTVDVPEERERKETAAVTTPKEPGKVLGMKPRGRALPKKPKLVSIEPSPPAETPKTEILPPTEPTITPEVVPVGREWSDLFWALVRCQDLPAAYWLARSWESQGASLPIPSWLLAAVQGARWLTRARDKIAEDLSEIVHQHELSAGATQRLYGIAAALVPSLVAPIIGLVSWLEDPHLPGLSRLVAVVKTYASFGHALRQKDLSSASGQAHLSVEMDDVLDRAKQWLSEAPLRRVSLKRATDVWYHWVQPPNGELRLIMSLVADDRQDAIAQVRAFVEGWRRNPIADRMHNDDMTLHGRRSRPIVGAARNKLVNDAEDALRLAEEWYDLVDRQQEVDDRGDWFSKRVQQLVEGIQMTLPDAKAELGALAADTSAGPEALAAQAVMYALEQLGSLLGLPGAKSSSGDVGPFSQRGDLQGGLWDALAYRLLLLPEATLDDEGQPTSETLSHLAGLLMAAHQEERGLRDAFNGWLAGQDYRFGQALLTALSQEPDIADLNRRWQEAMNGSRASLREAIQHTTDDVEQAFIDNVIAEDVKSEYDARMEAVRAGEATRRYGPLYERLENVQHDLQQSRTLRLQQQRSWWTKIHRRLETEGLERTLCDQIVEFMQEALERKDIAVLDERLASLEESLDRGQTPDATWFRPSAVDRDCYQEFLDSLSGLDELLNKYNLQGIIRALESERRVEGLDLPRLPRPRIEETVEAMQAWRQLKKQGGPFQLNRQHVADILRYLGFSFVGYPPSAIQERQPRGLDWVYLRVNMSAGGLSPIPEFGSKQDGHFNVVCLWERPALDTIGARLHDLNLQYENVVVLYFGRLVERQRLDLVRFARERRLGMVFLDEILLVFLAREYESRLPVFLRCALPLAYVNPYVETGIVMPEMFFGRDDMIGSLQEGTGKAIVYGGRQLGKSALLRRLVLFHITDIDF